MQDIEKNFDDQTMLPDWWRQMKRNLERIEQHIKNEFLDHPDGSVIRAKLSQAVKAELDGLRADTDKKAEKTAVDTALTEKADKAALAEKADKTALAEKVDCAGGIFQTTPRLSAGEISVALENTRLTVGEKKNDVPGEGFLLPYTYDTDLTADVFGVLYQTHIHIAEDMPCSYAATGTDAQDLTVVCVDFDFESGVVAKSAVLGVNPFDADQVTRKGLRNFMLVDCLNAGERSLIGLHRIDGSDVFAQQEQGCYLATRFDLEDLTDEINQAVDGKLTAKADKASVDTAFAGKADKISGSGGFAGGENANTGSGKAAGGAIGKNTYSYRGFAGGEEAKCGYGAALGYSAKCMTADASKMIDAIQLGTGTNTEEKSLQVYDKKLMKADGTIPAERLGKSTVKSTVIADGAVTLPKLADEVIERLTAAVPQVYLNFGKSTSNFTPGELSLGEASSWQEITMDACSICVNGRLFSVGQQSFEVSADMNTLTNDWKVLYLRFGYDGNTCSGFDYAIHDDRYSGGISADRNEIEIPIGRICTEKDIQPNQVLVVIRLELDQKSIYSLPVQNAAVSGILQTAEKNSLAEAINELKALYDVLETERLAADEVIKKIDEKADRSSSFRYTYSEERHEVFDVSYDPGVYVYANEVTEIENLPVYEAYSTDTPQSLTVIHGGNGNYNHGTICLGDNGRIWTLIGIQYGEDGGKKYQWKELGAENPKIMTGVDTSVVLTPENNAEYRYGVLTSLSLTLPDQPEPNYAAYLVFSSGATATEISYPDALKWSGEDVIDGIFTPLASRRYNVGLWYDGVCLNGVVRGVGV